MPFVIFMMLMLSAPVVQAADWPTGTLAAYDFDIGHKDIVLDQTFTVRDFRSYVLSLRFRYEDHADLHRVLALVGYGSSTTHSGNVVPLNIQLFRVTDGIADTKPMIDRLIDTKSSYVHAFIPPDFKSGAFGRKIVTVDLPPGNYRIRASTIQDSPEFSGTPCQLVVEAYANLRFVPNSK